MAGRPTDYREEYIAKVEEYLASKLDTYEVLGDKNPIIKYKVQLPTIEGFARFIGVNKTTLYEWSKVQDGFSNALDKIRTEQQERLINQGLSGNYNSTIAKLILSSNHGMREGIDTTSGGEKIQSITGMVISKDDKETTK